MEQNIRRDFQCKNRISGPMRSGIQEDKWIMLPSLLVDCSHFKSLEHPGYLKGYPTHDSSAHIPESHGWGEGSKASDKQFELISYSGPMCRDWSPRPENC